MSVPKVDSWQHEIKLSIMSNKDQISEEKNETLTMKEDISQLIEEIKVLKSVVDENKELIEANKIMCDKMIGIEKKVDREISPSKWTVKFLTSCYKK